VDNPHGTVSQTPPLGAVSSLLEPYIATASYKNFSSDPLFAPGGPTQNDIHQGGFGDTSILGDTPTLFLSDIETALDEGKIVTAGTIATPAAADYVVGAHRYTVESVQTNKKGVPISITLRNPWGYGGPGVKANPSAYGTLTASQFFNDFFGADVASA
jgi:hypothetical protein